MEKGCKYIFCQQKPSQSAFMLNRIQKLHIFFWISIFHPQKISTGKNPKRQKRRCKSCLTIPVIILWTPLPARLWTSSRWRPLLIRLYLCHLESVLAEYSEFDELRQLWTFIHTYGSLNSVSKHIQNFREKSYDSHISLIFLQKSIVFWWEHLQLDKDYPLTPQ